MTMNDHDSCPEDFQAVLSNTVPDVEPQNHLKTSQGNVERAADACHEYRDQHQVTFLSNSSTQTSSARLYCVGSPFVHHLCSVASLFEHFLGLLVRNDGVASSQADTYSCAIVT